MDKLSGDGRNLTKLALHASCFMRGSIITSHYRARASGDRRYYTPTLLPPVHLSVCSVCWLGSLGTCPWAVCLPLTQHTDKPRSSARHEPNIASELNHERCTHTHTHKRCRHYTNTLRAKGGGWTTSTDVQIIHSERCLPSRVMPMSSMQALSSLDMDGEGGKVDRVDLIMVCKGVSPCSTPLMRAVPAPRAAHAMV